MSPGHVSDPNHFTTRASRPHPRPKNAVWPHARQREARHNRTLSQRNFMRCVSHRIKRQAILHREQPPPYTAVIHEAALRMRFGDRTTIRAQLHHLNEMSELDHITLAVIPFDNGPFHTSGQGIDYLHGPVHQLDTVQLDTDHGAELIDSPAQLERYHLVLDRMQQAALPPAKSRDFIAQLAQDL
ncbi:DUF5753 domain-containing protein [Streptomyces sp. NBC_01483]